MKTHHYNVNLQCLQLAISINQEEFKQNLELYRDAVMHGDLFGDILNSLEKKKDQLENEEDEPVVLEEDQKIAGLNYLLSKATKDLRTDEFSATFKSLVL